jgi:NADH-quinone oxidoreductase subunit C
VARRPRREPTIPEAPAALDAIGEALSATLEQVFEADSGMQIGAAVDEVTFTVPPDRVIDVCNVCRTDPRLDFDYLRCLSVVDYVESAGVFEVNYHLYSLDKRHKMVVKTRVPEDQPSVPTVTGVWAGANWYERESHDLFGVVFEGHPELIPLLLYEEFEGFPGRRSFPFHDYDEW